MDIVYSNAQATGAITFAPSKCIRTCASIQIPEIQLQTMSLVQSLWARAARSVSDTIM